ncbi:MAG: helix-turn-helix domain-containing protein [Deltaproteobacteria bacterium]|nr:helix-turn-helix domain-containing protein [Deltaproteobacteria bacterium]
MKISLREAAQLLGKSERQVRYMVKEGRLQAHKDGSRWLIERSDLPLPPSAVQRGVEERARLTGVLEAALGPAESPRKRYSVTDLKVFEAGRTLYPLIAAAAGEDSSAARRLREGLGLVACGCHTFQRRDKVTFFQKAREQLCFALSALLLGDETQRGLGQRLEGEVLPSLGGLLRAAERHR